MRSLFSLELLPAKDGECLWIEYGDPGNPSRILIDAGRAGTHKEVLRRIESAAAPVHFELIVITHVDLDNIGGVLKLLAGKKPPSRRATSGSTGGAISRRERRSHAGPCRARS